MLYLNGCSSANVRVWCLYLCYNGICLLHVERWTWKMWAPMEIFSLNAHGALNKQMVYGRAYALTDFSKKYLIFSLAHAQMNEYLSFLFLWYATYMPCYFHLQSLEANISTRGPNTIMQANNTRTTWCMYIVRTYRYVYACRLLYADCGTGQTKYRDAVNLNDCFSMPPDVCGLLCSVIVLFRWFIDSFCRRVIIYWQKCIFHSIFVL